MEVRLVIFVLDVSLVACSSRISIAVLIVYADDVSCCRKVEHRNDALSINVAKIPLE